MSSVLVGMFDTQSAATNARERLIQEGFPETMLSLTGDSATSAMPTETGGTTSSKQEGPIARFFKDIFGGDNTESEYRPTYDEAFRRGSCGLTVSVSNDQELDRAAEILNSAGAVDIDERSQQWRNEGWTGGATMTPGGTVPGAATSAGASDALEAGATRKLQEVEEELQVGKRSVSRGGVRVFSRVIEVPVEETVTLREEHAEVQRREVDRPATEADLASFKEGAIEVRETGEEAVVAKTARVVGEVEISKHVTERDETVGDTVRKTKVDVEQIPAGRSRFARRPIDYQSLPCKPRR